MTYVRNFQIIKCVNSLFGICCGISSLQRVVGTTE